MIYQILNVLKIKLPFSQKIIFFYLTFGIATISNCQILTITERSKGKSRVVELESKQIVDINSGITVSISKKELIQNIVSKFPDYSETYQFQERIEALRTALEFQEILLQHLEKSVINIRSREDFLKLMLDFLEVVENDPYLSSRYEEVNDNYFLVNREGESISDQSQYIFRNLEKDLEILLKELESVKKDNEHYISLVAYKKNGRGDDRVHVENFDIYSEREYHTVQRWVTSISEEQKNNLAQLSSFAQNINQKRLSISDQLKQLFEEYIFSSIDCVKNQVLGIEMFLENTKVQRQFSEAMRVDGNILLDKVKAYDEVLDIFSKSIKKWEITTPFELKIQFKELVNQASSIQIDMQDFQQTIATVDALKDEVNEIKQDVEECLDEIKGIFESIPHTWDALQVQQSNYLANKQFSEKVLIFGTENIPDSGYINLKGTGSRENGDELEIELLLRLPSSQKDIPDHVISIEKRVLVMHLIGARSEIVVGMIIANPDEKSASEIDFDRKFYFAPSASLLLKVGSRNSFFYNEFLDFGIGLNLASTDFDTDGSPEFGTGFIVTGFKDILSLGINYNVTLETPYWFFGVNLPFNIPGLPINRIK